MDEFFEKLKQALGIQTRVLNAQEHAALEATLYTVCTAAFGMFVRWMQKMLAFNENNLPDKSFWNWATPVTALIVALIFIRLIDKMKNRRWFLTKNYTEVYVTDSKVLLLIEIFGGFLVFLGGVLLISETEAAKNPIFYIVTGVLAMCAAIVLPLITISANRRIFRAKTLRLISLLPLLYTAAWLICTYQANSINSVVLDFGLEIITICILMITMFRLCGIFYYSFKPSRTMFFCMFGAFACVMNIADSHYFGEQLMFVGLAAILGSYNWAMICNMQQREAPKEISIQDGFERVGE